MERCTYRSKPLEFRSILYNNGVHCYKQIDLNFAKESSKAREKNIFLRRTPLIKSPLVSLTTSLALQNFQTWQFTSLSFRKQQRNGLNGAAKSLNCFLTREEKWSFVVFC